MVLKAVPGGEFWISGCHFESPGRINNPNILDISSLVQTVLEGKILPNMEYEVYGRL